MVTTQPKNDVDSATASRRAFVLAQVHGLDPLGFVTFAVPTLDGFAYVEVSRDEHGSSFMVEVGASSALDSNPVRALGALGFESDESAQCFRWKGSESTHAANLATSALDGPLAVAGDAPLDVRHGSRRAAVELTRKLSAIRQRIRAAVESVVDADGVLEDADGDLYFTFDSTRVWVGTRILASTEIIVRVFALAAAEIDPSTALALFLAQANFTLAIGKFTIDVMRHTVWFEEALLGELFSDEELRRTIELVAVTANEYDDQIARMFGGKTAREATEITDSQLHEKPGRSGYL